MNRSIPPLEYKGYKGIVRVNPYDNRLWGKIYSPENPSTPLDDREFAGNNIQEAETIFRHLVDEIISHKKFHAKCTEWGSKTDMESVRCVWNILPHDFKQRVLNNQFDQTLLEAVQGGDYEVPLYYVTKAWDTILKGELFPIDFMIGPEEEEDCTEDDIKEFLLEEDATRTRCEAYIDNYKMKQVWKELFNIDINSLEIDFLNYNMHLPPNVSYDDYLSYFTDVPNGVEEWILRAVNHPDCEEIYHDDVSSLMEFTAAVLLRRKGVLR